MSLSKGADSLEMSGDTELGRFCGACREGGVQRTGEKFCIDCCHFLCSTCVDCHSKFKFLKEHKIVENTSEDTTNLAKVMRSCLLCPNHPHKTVEVVCKNHDVLCCITCVTVAHRNCSQVVEITNEATKETMVRETCESMDHLTAAKSYIENIIKTHSTSTSVFISAVNGSFPKEIKVLKETLIKSLDQLEKNINCEIQRMTLEHVAKRKEDISKWSRHLNTITGSQKLLASTQENGSDTHLYVVMHKIKKELSDIDNAISALGFQMEREKLEMNKTQFAQSIIQSNARDLVTLSVKEESVPLPTYKYVASIEKSPYTSKKPPRATYMFCTLPR